MPNETNLTSMRDELLSFNLEFLDFLGQRQVLVNNIQEIKKSLGQTQVWDPKQELKVFQKILSIKSNIEKNYLYMFSMLIETQASKLYTYPKWSESEHLNKTSGRIIDYINPILLYILSPDDFNSLDLKSEYKLQILNISGE